MSAFLALTDAVRDALLQTPALAGGNVTRGQAVPVRASADQAIEVRIVRSTADAAVLAGSVLQWQTQVAIELYARAAAAQDGEVAIDSLLAGVFTRMSATAPPSGVISWALEPDIQWDVAEADATLVQASLALRITHFTTTDLAAAA